MVIDDMDPEELEYGNDLVDNGVEAEDSESDRGPWRSTLSSDASLASWCNMECLHVERCISLFSHGEHGRRAATTDLAGNIDFGGGAGHYGTGRAAGWPLGGDGGTRRRLFAIRSDCRLGSLETRWESRKTICVPSSQGENRSKNLLGPNASLGWLHPNLREV
ncbi:unnamed protein product [Mycena citricolor]|uniref:Uncharacterized protein n=1 Tax=Mycena citricolor TaxID=2018698 RepID=A0AAD2HHK4_9AGAR|nr:unnamed protein product [Mycena citricolor]CAK5276006.1 unnamed protein product [Mycena citricolor]